MTSTSTSIPILLARLAESQVGFAANAVREIVRSVAIAPLPGAPAIILLQLQQSVDAMSLEVERISESQRFQSKLLFEQKN